MLTLVNDVCQRQHLTLLMVSHSVEDAARIAPRVAGGGRRADRPGRRDRNVAQRQQQRPLTC